MGARALGVNHVALEVGDLDAALAFYGRLFEVTLRGRSPGMAFIDMRAKGFAPNPPNHR